MNLIKTLILLVIFVSHVNAKTQQDSVSAKLSVFVKNINTFNQLYPQEKVYLHFDNTGYYLGETIWFKAYVVVAENNQPTILSRVLYVELLAPNGEILETKKLKIEHGQCHGEFFLKPERYGGFYEVRAYTNLMLNWEGTVFSRVFPVFDSPQKEGDYTKQTFTERPRSQQSVFKRETAEKRENINMDFFPEGGNLVAGSTSRVAFKITDNEGRSVEANGTIRNEQKEIITSFASVHNGMGYFVFTPEAKAQYTASINYNNKEYTFKIPDFSGNYTIAVDNLRPDFLFIQIQRDKNYLGEPIGISVACRGKVYIFETSDMVSQNECLLKIPKSALPTGVNQITAFTSKGEIVAERLVFIDHHDQQIPITIKQDKAVYEPFEKIGLEFQLQNQVNHPISAIFSLSVTDAETSSFTTSNSMFSELLLTSDLKGYIENPDFYFESNDIQHQSALDLLMMTQGWRRYSWKQMAGVEPFELKYYIEKGIVIDGQVLSSFREKKKENMEITMWAYSDNGFSQKGRCITDKEGRFNFLLDDFTGEWKLGLQTKENDKRKENRILLNRWFAPSAKSYSVYETTLASDSPIVKNFSNEPEISQVGEAKDDSIHSNLLQEVTITEHLKKTNITTQYEVGAEVDKLRDSGKSYTGNILQFLSNIDPLFNYEIRPVFMFTPPKSEKDPPLYLYDPGYRKRLVENMDIILCNYDEYDENGKPLRTYFYDIRYKGKPATIIINNRNFNEGEVETIDIDQIKEISISQKQGIDAPYNSQGGSSGTLITFHTYEDNRMNGSPKGIRMTTLQGYSNVREFYSPDYSHGVLPDEKDYRRTLYWNPDVNTDENGKATVSFYNNSCCRKIDISAEGITKEGIIICK